MDSTIKNKIFKDSFKNVSLKFLIPINFKDETIELDYKLSMQGPLFKSKIVETKAYAYLIIFFKTFK